MKIAVIAPPFLEIPPKGQGGTEVVVYELVEELVRRGHQVTLFGCGNAQTSAKFVQVFPTAVNDTPVDPGTMESSRKLRLEMTYFGDISTRLLDMDPFDVVFNHTRGEVAFAPLTRTYPSPIISTYHLPILPEIISVLERNPRAFAIAISENQQRRAKDVPNFVGVAYNGVDLEKFPFNDSPDDYLFWIGTIGVHKNTAVAVQAALKTGKKLILAGKIRDQEYYESEVKPHIDDDQITYLGQIPFEEKIPLFKNAAASLFPTAWDEPFGLVAIEALACGTPVIAYPNGALPEIIEDGHNGFLVDSVDGMAEAIKKLDSIDRADCRESVAEKFTLQKMTASYLAAAKTATERLAS